MPAGACSGSGPRDTPGECSGGEGAKLSRVLRDQMRKRRTAFQPAVASKAMRPSRANNSAKKSMDASNSRSRYIGTVLANRIPETPCEDSNADARRQSGTSRREPGESCRLSHRSPQRGVLAAGAGRFSGDQFGRIPFTRIPGEGSGFSGWRGPMARHLIGDG